MTESSIKIAGVILAAGSASRMGKTKQLLPYKNKPILEHVIINARQSNLHEIVVVLGHCASEIQNSIDLSGIKTVINSEYSKGQSTSLIKGLENISSFSDAAMFFLGDQPLVKKTAINIIIKAFKSSNQPVAIPYYNNIRGNPVIIARSLFHELQSLSGDTGPRILFKKMPSSILAVPVSDKAILMDVDTKEDYKKLLSK
jgi:molybdenum cofactor cytidylyltransferase